MNALPRYIAPTDAQLTEAMLADYRDSGVLVLEEFVTHEQCDGLRHHIRSLVEAFDPSEATHVFSTAKQSQVGDPYFEESGDKIRFFLEPDALDPTGRLRFAKEDCLNKMGHAMHDLDPEFDRFSRTPDLQKVTASLGFEDPAIIQSMVIFKPPRIGGEVGWHQDSTFLYTQPLSCVGFWFALEDATADNGCMRFMPGAHKLGLKQRHFRGADGKLAFEQLDDGKWPVEHEVAAEVPAGTLVIFDGCAPHRSGPNLSDNSRQAYTIHFIDQTCRYADDNWLQRDPTLKLRGFEAVH